MIFNFLIAGNMDTRMAEAVEGASAVLVCFSAKYQASENCKKGTRMMAVYIQVVFGWL